MKSGRSTEVLPGDRRHKTMEWGVSTFLPTEMSEKEQRFHEAASYNDVDALMKVLTEGVNINCRNSLDRTALHCSAANGHVEVTDVLLSCKADLEVKDKFGMKPVLWAAWFGHLEVVKQLVNSGACKFPTSKQGMGPVHCAAANGHADVISFIFETPQLDQVNVTENSQGRTALHLATEAGHVEVVDRLLNLGADTYIKEKTGCTALHLAALKGHGEITRRLLLTGVEVDETNTEGNTAVHMAAENGHEEVLDVLLEHNASPNSETSRQFTPLHLAAAEGHADICRILVRSGSNLNAQNCHKNTALHVAAVGNHPAVIRVLVECEADLDIQNCRQQTALHVAVEVGHVNVVQVLLEGGANLDLRDKSGKSAVQLAARGNHVAIVDMLIRAYRFNVRMKACSDNDEVDYPPQLNLRQPTSPGVGSMKEILWTLATRQLRPGDWKLLASHWNFEPEHIRAIEHEYIGSKSYREHSYRLLTIWLYGVPQQDNVVKQLFEALLAISRKQLAEQVRRRANRAALGRGKTSPKRCTIS